MSRTTEEIRQRLNELRRRRNSKKERREQLLKQARRLQREIKQLAPKIRKLKTKLKRRATPTRVSKAGLDLIKRFEGLSLVAYKPVSGEQYWTIGYGHYGPDVRPGQKITEAEAIRLLRQDLRRFERAVRSAVKVPLTQNQFDALVSFTFNVGEGAFRSSTLLRKLNAGHYSEVPGELAKWVYGANGVRLEGLVRRRAAEAELWRRRG